jgi:hypothetical protein
LRILKAETDDKRTKYEPTWFSPVSVPRLPFKALPKPAQRSQSQQFRVGLSSPGNETSMVMYVDSKASSKHPVVLTAHLDPGLFLWQWLVDIPPELEPAGTWTWA